ncbi:hypothetical protein LOAG_15926, partial [Loa loa]
EDRKDKSAVGWDEHGKLATHQSQVDYKKGFGGKFGIQEDRKDKSAVGWDDYEKLDKHESQTDYKRSFDGHFDLQDDRQYKSAVDTQQYNESTQHENQKEYAKEEQVPRGNALPVAPKGRALNLRAKFEQLSVAE